MEQIGVVIKEDGDYIEIISTRESACGSDCSSCAAKCSESKPFTIRTINTINAKLGDRVKIEMSSKAVLSYMLLVYGLPLVFFLIGVVVTSEITKKLGFGHIEIYSLIAGVVLMAIAYIIIKKIDSKYKNLATNNVIIKKY